MRVLSIDTSTWWGGVALVEQRSGRVDVVAECGHAAERSHARWLLLWADGLLSLAGWPRSSLDGYVGTRGPGSFTGVRIGLGTIQGLALASGRPCVGVGTLEALAEAHGPAELERVCLVAAGDDSWFRQRWDAAGSPAVALEDPWIESGEPLGLEPSAVVVPAFGSEELARRVASVRGWAVASAPRGVAASAGRLALLGNALSRSDTPLSPLYLRPPNAELGSRRA